MRHCSGPSHSLFASKKTGGGEDFEPPSQGPSIKRDRCRVTMSRDGLLPSQPEPVEEIVPERLWRQCGTDAGGQFDLTANGIDRIMQVQWLFIELPFHRMTGLRSGRKAARKTTEIGQRHSSYPHTRGTHPSFALQHESLPSSQLGHTYPGSCQEGARMLPLLLASRAGLEPRSRGR